MKKKKSLMTVSFKVAEQPSELKVHTSGLSASALVSYRCTLYLSL